MHHTYNCPQNMFAQAACATSQEMFCILSWFWLFHRSDSNTACLHQPNTCKCQSFLWLAMHAVGGAAFLSNTQLNGFQLVVCLVYVTLFSCYHCEKNHPSRIAPSTMVPLPGSSSNNHLWLRFMTLLFMAILNLASLNGWCGKTTLNTISFLKSSPSGEEIYWA